MEKTITVNGKPYAVIRLLGKGKGGYSWLAADGQKEYVLKQIHHEPCSYYQFGNKMEAELSAYRKLREMGIRIPALLDSDLQNERILKEYIPGETILDLLEKEQMKETYLRQIRRMSRTAEEAGINLDYFPTNFVVCRDELFYIDYECNEYSDQWNFENWGNRYWSRTPELLEHLALKEASEDIQKE